MHNLHGTSPTRLPAPSLRRPASRLPLVATAPAADGPAPIAARYLARRLAEVLGRLGLLDVVLPGWVSVDGATVRFDDLDVPTADHLLRHLEALAACLDDDDYGSPAVGWRQARLSEASA